MSVNPLAEPNRAPLILAANLNGVERMGHSVQALLSLFGGPSSCQSSISKIRRTARWLVPPQGDIIGPVRRSDDDGRTVSRRRWNTRGGEGVTRSPADKLTSKHPSSFSVGRSPSVRPIG